MQFNEVRNKINQVKKNWGSYYFASTGGPIPLSLELFEEFLGDMEKSLTNTCEVEQCPTCTPAFFECPKHPVTVCNQADGVSYANALVVLRRLYEATQMDFTKGNKKEWAELGDAQHQANIFLKKAKK